MTTTPTTDIDALADQAAQARQAFEAAQAAADRAAAQAEQRRAAALADYDQHRLDAYDDVALTADVAEAGERLRQAILDDPVWSAFVDWAAAGVRRHALAAEASGDASRLGIDASLPHVPAAEPGPDTFVQHAYAEVSRRVAELTEQRNADRTAAGDAAASST